MISTLRDIGYCVRRLVKARGFLTTTIVLLSLAFAVNAVVFSLVYDLLYKPLPFSDANRQTILTMHNFKTSENDGRVWPELVRDIQQDKQTLSSSAMVAYGNLWTTNGIFADRAPLMTLYFQPQIFGILGLAPAVGRLPTSEDTLAKNPGYVWASWKYAVQRFGTAANAMGKELVLEDGRYRIAGVMPRDARLASRPVLWRPIAFSKEDLESDLRYNIFNTAFIGHLATGVTRATATERLTARMLGTPTMQDYPEKSQLQLVARPLRELFLLQGVGERSLTLMLGTALMILLITGVNVCNLYIARRVQCQHETAILAALGAGPARLGRLQIIEAMLISGLSAGVGLTLAVAGLAALKHYDLEPLEVPSPIGVDSATVLYVGMLALVLGVSLTASGLWVQRGVARVHELLKQGGLRQTAGTRVQRARLILTTAQVALTMSLLVGAGLLDRSAHKLLAEDVGFSRSYLLMTGLAMQAEPATKQATENTLRADWVPYQAVVRNLRARAAALPGVLNTTLVSSFPFSYNQSLQSYQAPGSEEPATSKWPLAQLYDNVEPEYFAVMGQPLAMGRPFTDEESRAHAPVVIVDASFARRYFRGISPLGRYFRFSTAEGDSPSNSSRVVTIIGVARDVKTYSSFGQKDDHPSLYLPGTEGSELLIRTSIDPALLQQPLTAIARQLSPRAALGIFGVMTSRLEEYVQSRYRLNALLDLLSAITLILAGVGLYAVLAYSVRVRMTEWGVRLALGATGAQLQRDVLAQGLRLVAIGFCAGLPLAWGISRLLSSQLYGISSMDPVTLLSVAAIVTVVSLLASWLPARAAARVDPMIVLRSE